MFLLFGVAIAATACPETPRLRDDDAALTVLEQNLKFIATGTHRAERASLLADYLDGEGASVDLMLLSEARLTGALEAWSPGWCFYSQAGNGVDEDYAWTPIERRRSPGGLALGVRQRVAGTLRVVGTGAGRRFRARPVTLAEGFLGRVFGYRKGWVSVVVDGTQLVWSHAQASYRGRPEAGAGREGRGRVGQFADLAADLGRPVEATLLTGDLNLLSGFNPHCQADEPRVCRAREIDAETVAAFRERTGVDLDHFASVGTFLGSIFAGEPPDTWNLRAPYDRVGVNPAFLTRHPGAEVSPVEIGDHALRLSDHLGLRIVIPFAAEPNG